MDPFVGEIRLFGGNFQPVGWVFCNGQTLPVAGNEALYSLLGTTFGGDGVANFGVPNLQMRLAVGQSTTAPLGMTNTYLQGATGGAFNVAPSAVSMPAHSHTMVATSNAATTVTPGNTVMFAAVPSGFTTYMSPTGTPTLVSMNTASISQAGGGQVHDNKMPTLCISYIMCTSGLYPSFN